MMASIDSRANPPTFMPELHFLLERLEVFRYAGFGLSTHPLAGPLLEATEFLIDVHLRDVQRRSLPIDPAIACLLKPVVSCESSPYAGGVEIELEFWFESKKG